MVTSTAGGLRKADARPLFPRDPDKLMAPGGEPLRGHFCFWQHGNRFARVG